MSDIANRMPLEKGPDFQRLQPQNTSYGIRAPGTRHFLRDRHSFICTKKITVWWIVSQIPI
jgi:hypothetical protein